MNLIFVTTQREWGGSEPLWVEAATRAAREGHEVTAVFPHGAQPHDGYRILREAGVTIVTRPARMEPTVLRRIGWKMQGVSKPEVEWWRQRFARTPNVVCVSQGACYCALTLPGLIEWLREMPCPYVLVCHSHRSRALPERKYVPQLQKLFRSAGAVGFVAEANRREAEVFLSVELPQAHILQNPLNLKADGAVPWPATEQPLQLACVGRIDFEDKGQDLLIEALAAEVWQPRDFTLDVFGSGPDEATLRSLIEKRGLQTKVRLAGFERDVRKIWATHHVLVMPSRSEGTPISLIEAQLCARPAVVTAVDGNSEWVVDDETGFLASEATVSSLSEALERMWENRSQLEQMGEAARSACLAKRDVDPGGRLLEIILEHSRR
jgi:glycosyltransferase involved in cell wall biosynthesis